MCKGKQLMIKVISHHSKFGSLCPGFSISIVAFEDKEITMDISNYKFIVLFRTSQQ